MAREFMANRNTYTPDPHEKTMGELLVEEREAKLRKTFIHDDDDEDSIQIGGIYTSSAETTPVKEERSIAELLAEEQMKNIRALYAEKKVDVDVLEISDSSPSGNPTPFPDPLISDFFHPSLEPVERTDVFLDEIEAFLASDAIPTMVDNANFDPEEDIRLLEELLNEDPSTSLPPMSNEDLVEVESYSDSHNEYTTSDEDSCGDIDDDDLVPRVSETFDKTFTNPLFDFESDFNQISNNPIFDILSDESEMEPEVQDLHDLLDSPHGKFSDELSHTMSQPDVENDENGFQRNVLTKEFHNDD